MDSDDLNCILGALEAIRLEIAQANAVKLQVLMQPQGAPVRCGECGYSNVPGTMGWNGVGCAACGKRF